MENILSQYRSYLQSITTPYIPFTDGSTISGMKARMGELQRFINEINDKGVEKANSYLTDETILIDKEKLKTALLEITHSHIQTVMRNNFHTTQG